MENRLEILKGIHPGLYLDRVLNKRKIKGRAFAGSIGEHPQTISAIINGRRRMNVPLSLKIEKELGIEEGFLMSLQIFNDIDNAKKLSMSSHKPDRSKFRDSLFWDTKWENIDWVKNKEYVIKRVFERGEDHEIKQIIKFYGEGEVVQILEILRPHNSRTSENIKKFLPNEKETLL